MQELEIDRIAHRCIDTEDPLGRHRFLRQKLVPDADGKALGHFPVIGINSHTIRIIIEPFIRFAISRHKTLDHVTALRQCLGVDDVNADGLTMRQRRVAAAGDQSYLALVERIKPEWRRRPAHVHLA